LRSRKALASYWATEAFNSAQAMTDPGLVLISKRDCRLSLSSGHASKEIAPA
jgi:hypothetical protein